MKPIKYSPFNQTDHQYSFEIIKSNLEIKELMQNNLNMDIQEQPRGDLVAAVSVEQKQEIKNMASLDLKQKLESRGPKEGQDFDHQLLVKSAICCLVQGQNCLDIYLDKLLLCLDQFNTLLKVSSHPILGF